MSLLIKSIIFILLLNVSLNAGVIKDLNTTKKVFGSSPPMNYLIYALNPEKTVGLNFKIKEQNSCAGKQFLNNKFLSLPILGTFHGEGQGINLEKLLKHKPDLILVWEDDMLIEKISKEIAKTDIPTISIPFRKIEDMPKSIRLAATTIDEEQRGELLSSYTDNIIDEIKSSLKDTKPIRYYYAEGLDGLSTECDSSFHVEALNFANGENVHKCRQRGLLGLEKINFETLLSYNPEIIIVQDSLTYNKIINNPLWRHLQAVKNKNIHLIPDNPFNWVDRPTSFMRIMGIQWLANLFHPKEYAVNIHKKTAEFYKLFFNVELTDKDIKQLLGEKHD